MTPLVTFVTRCHQRPQMLQHNIDSVTVQSELDWEQIFLVDHQGRGLVWANGQLAKKKHHVKGNWVYILDDDCKLLNADLVSRIARTPLKNHNVIMVKSHRPQMSPQILPPPKVWGSKQAILDTTPKSSVLNCLCYLVRRDLWMKHIASFGGSISGAWTFAKAFLPEAEIHWFDGVVAETQQLGRGRKFEAVSPTWWSRVVQRNGLTQDGAVWRRTG